MKKLSLFYLVLALCIGAVHAAPIDVNLAKSYGQKYVWNTLGQKSASLSLAYTQTSDAGMDALYVFNHENGYVVVSADDRAHPILGYSEEDVFDVDNIPDGLRYYLGYYARQIQYAVDNELPVDPMIAEEWYLLDKEGAVSRTRMDRAVSPLLSTQWNQDYPYNFYAPSASWGPGGRCYAGCVACAMSQVMKYWNWPDTGVGEHSYNTSSYGGTLSVNFGETSYNWSIMPTVCSTANDAGKAVALLMYHCGVAVDMDYKPTGSGAQTGAVPDAVIEHFKYGVCTQMLYRDDYSRTAWEDMLIESFDNGIPVVYSGHESDGSGGHAFNCDGYNDQRYFHFNWGWGPGYNNSYYQIDALNTSNGTFNSYQGMVFDMIPDYLYNAIIPAMETMTAQVTDVITKTVTVNWTVPTQSVSGVDLENVQEIALKRNGTLIQTYSNVQPGETISFEDQVDNYGEYVYSIAGKNNNLWGEVFEQMVIVGPQCTWRFVCQTTNFQGWNGGKIQVVGPNGMVFKEITMTNSSPLSQKVQFPEGDFTLRWVAPSTTVNSLTIMLKNSANQNVYNYSGSSSQLSETIYTGVNDCPNCTPPMHFSGEFTYHRLVWGTILTWSCDYTPSKFIIYRSEDGVEYEELVRVNGNEHEYFDETPMDVTYYYKVTAYNTACESTPALTDDDTDFVMVVIPDVTSVAENGIEARVYPNPTSGTLHIEAEALNTVAVYNLVGQKVYEESLQDKSCTIDMKTFGCGMYLVKISSANGSVTRKVTVID